MTKRLISGMALVLLFAVALFPFQTSLAAPLGVSLTWQFRFVNANPSAPTLDAGIDNVPPVVGSKTIGVAPLKVSGYVTETNTTDPENHVVSLFDTGTTTSYANSSSLSFAAKGDYTIALFPDGTFQPYSDVKVAPATGMFTVRFANFSPDGTYSLALNSTVPTGFGNIAYKSMSANYLPFAEGTYTVDLMKGSTVVYTMPHNNTFAAGKVYTLFAMGSSASSDLTIQVGTDASFVTVTPPGGLSLFLPLITR